MKSKGDSVQVGSILVSTRVRGASWTLAYEVVSKSRDAVTLVPIEWERYRATVEEVLYWGTIDPVTGKRTPNKTKQVRRSFGRPAKGRRSGIEEKRTLEQLGRFGQFGVEWPDRKERAYLYYEGIGYPISDIRDRAPDTERGTRWTRTN